MTRDWTAVDRLIRELGSLRIGELETTVLDDEDPHRRALSAAVNRVADEVTCVVAAESDDTLARAWQAVASAQDSLTNARAFVDAARAARSKASSMREETLAQRKRALEQARVAVDLAARVRGRQARLDPSLRGRPEKEKDTPGGDDDLE